MTHRSVFNVLVLVLLMLFARTGSASHWNGNPYNEIRKICSGGIGEQAIKPLKDSAARGDLKAAIELAIIYQPFYPSKWNHEQSTLMDDLILTFQGPQINNSNFRDCLIQSNYSEFSHWIEKAKAASVSQHDSLWLNKLNEMETYTAVNRTEENNYKIRLSFEIGLTTLMPGFILWLIFKIKSRKRRLAEELKANIKYFIDGLSEVEGQSALSTFIHGFHIQVDRANKLITINNIHKLTPNEFGFSNSTIHKSVAINVDSQLVYVPPSSIGATAYNSGAGTSTYVPPHSTGRSVYVPGNEYVSHMTNDVDCYIVKVFRRKSNEPITEIKFSSRKKDDYELFVKILAQVKTWCERTH